MFYLGVFTSQPNDSDGKFGSLSIYLLIYFSLIPKSVGETTFRSGISPKFSNGIIPQFHTTFKGVTFHIMFEAITKKN